MRIVGPAAPSQDGLDLPGFAAPVADAQACFRAVLDAMAHPGRIVAAGVGLRPPAPLAPAAAAVLLTLADADTPLWLDPALAAVAPWLAFQCGAPAAARDRAAFVVTTTLPALEDLACGTDAVPEAGATVILHVAGLGTGPTLRLSGPGLAAPTLLAAEGLPAAFLSFWSGNRALFPRGIDLVLCAGTRLVALPRSVTAVAP